MDRVIKVGIVSGLGAFVMGATIGGAVGFAEASVAKKEAIETKEMYIKKLKKLDEVKARTLEEVKQEKKSIKELKDTKTRMRDDIENLRSLALEEGGNFSHIVRMLESIRDSVDKTGELKELRRSINDIESMLICNENNMKHLSERIDNSAGRNLIGLGLN